MTKLVSVHDIESEFPDLGWPFKPDGTYRLIRRGKLGRVQVGRNYFVTRELLEQFIADHVRHEPRPVTQRPVVRSGVVQIDLSDVEDR